MTLEGDQAPFLPLKGRPNIQTQVLTTLMGSAPLTGSCASPGSIVHLKPLPQLTWRVSCSFRSNCLLVPVRITSPGGLKDATWWQRR
jgi:hypothetical protein